MTTLEEYLDQDRRCNRALTRMEVPLVDEWFDVALDVAMDRHEPKTLTGRRGWCEFNTNGFWTVTPLNRHNKSYRVYRFSDPRDAMTFKLIFGGTTPPQRKLP